MGGYRQKLAEENDCEYCPVIECEQKLILRDFAGALSAATQHVQSPALGLFATRERALAVAVQALHELGRGEEAFDLVLSTVAGPGGGYAEVADVNPGLLKLLFRLRMHLDGTPEKAQKILMPYIVRLCRRKDSFQRWSHRHAGVSEEDEVDVEVVELFLLDCVLAVEGADVASKTLESIASHLPEEAASLIRREILRSQLASEAPSSPQDTQHSKHVPKTDAHDASTRCGTAITWETQESAGGGVSQSSAPASAPSSHTDTGLGGQPASEPSSHTCASHPPATSNTRAGFRPKSLPLLEYLLRLLPAPVRRVRAFLGSAGALALLTVPLLILSASRSGTLRAWVARIKKLMSQVQGQGGPGRSGERGVRLWGPVLVVVVFLVCFIVVL